MRVLKPETQGTHLHSDQDVDRRPATTLGDTLMLLGKTSFLTLTTVIAILAAASHHAPARSADQLLTRFDVADANHDGKLTLAEAQKSMPRIARHFNHMDKAHVGAVTIQQITAFINA
jgi:hypothetical protein